MEIGDTVTVRGEEYVLTSRGPMGDGKFFGKRFFYLHKCSDGTEWRAHGKSVGWNSKLYPVA